MVSAVRKTLVYNAKMDVKMVLNYSENSILAIRFEKAYGSLSNFS